MLQPKRTKFRKHFRGKMRGAASTGSSVSFGEIGLKAMEASWITARQIEAARVAVTHTAATDSRDRDALARGLLAVESQRGARDDVRSGDHGGRGGQELTA